MRLGATDEQQVVKRSARERLEAFTTKKSGNLGRRKTTKHTTKHPHPQGLHANRWYTCIPYACP